METGKYEVNFLARLPVVNAEECLNFSPKEAFDRLISEHPELFLSHPALALWELEDPALTRWMLGHAKALNAHLWRAMEGHVAFWVDPPNEDIRSCPYDCLSKSDSDMLDGAPERRCWWLENYPSEPQWLASDGGADLSHDPEEWTLHRPFDLYYLDYHSLLGGVGDGKGMAQHER
jgi:hypothetical protein